MRLAAGQVHLTAIKLVAPLLTEANHRALLDQVAGKSRSAIEMLVASHRPQADEPSRLRKLPNSAGQLGLEPVPTSAAASGPTSRSAAAATVCSPPPASLRRAPAPTRLKPSAPGRHKLSATIDQALADKLKRLRALMRHQVPDGDFATLINLALMCEPHNLLLAERHNDDSGGPPQRRKMHDYSLN